LISADVIPTAVEEHASSPSSSEISIAKENRLSGECCSWKRKKMSYPKLSIDNTKSDKSGDLLASR
jgi:hypothetical protein